MSEDKKNKLKIKVPTHIVRNDGIQLNNGDFLLYARLCFLFFRNYQQEEIVINHKKLMLQIGITDTRTLKKYINNLYINKLIKNKIDSFSRKGETTIIFNNDIYNKKDQHFTMMNANIFNYMNIIGENEFRLVWYYKSHINLNDTNRNRSYCFVGYRTLSNNLKMSMSTIKNANEMLKKNKLIKIDKFKLEEAGENDNDELIFDRYNCHYYVSNRLF